MTISINITSTPSGADIFLNDVDITFNTPNTITINGFTSWTGKITVKLAGYPDYIQDVVAIDGQIINIHAPFENQGTTSPVLIMGAIVGLIALAYIAKTMKYKFEGSAAKRAGVKYIAT